ncbi:hypothetical protein CIRG_03707 [Coccidioides immitis RMSCC 2394]|uniref:Uncharacterized protein n=1 Tax=Coccidioides immitis RMSCC 2394 TaxID=404692 RepID=A0A0J6Y8J2_COCIT|nr:hypothetical protein CIRG_03707 [Coccidioides immitis RMSCC 2394]
MDILAVRDFAISEPLQEVQWREKRKGTVLRKGDRDLSGEGYGYLNGEDGGGIFPRTGEMRSNGNSERRGKEVLDSLSDFDRRSLRGRVQITCVSVLTGTLGGPGGTSGPGHEYGAITDIHEPLPSRSGQVDKPGSISSSVNSPKEFLA